MDEEERKKNPGIKKQGKKWGGGGGGGGMGQKREEKQGKKTLEKKIECWRKWNQGLSARRTTTSTPRHVLITLGYNIYS